MFLGHQRDVLEPWRHVKSIFSEKNFDLQIPLQTPFLAWAALKLQKCFKNEHFKGAQLDFSRSEQEVYASTLSVRESP